MTEIVSSPSITDLPNDILKDIVEFTGAIGRTVLGHVSKDFAEIVRGNTILPKNLCHDAVYDNQFEVLKWAHSLGCPFHVIPETAAKYGNFEMLKWMHAIDDDWSIWSINLTYDFAAKYGHWHIVKWLYSEGYDMNEHIYRKAARQGNQHMIEWLISTGQAITTAAFEKAAKGNHFELIKWLYQNGFRTTWHAPTVWLAKHGNIPALEWSIDHGFPINSSATAFAANRMQFETVKWLQSKGVPLSPRLWTTAAKREDKVFLRWLIDNGCPHPSNAYLASAEVGNIQIFKWLLKHKIPLGGHDGNTDACLRAAKGGHLEMLIWLRSNGYPWDANVCFHSASLCHFDVFKWARDNGCPCNDTDCAKEATAAKSKPKMSSRADISPIEGNDLKILKYLRKNGCHMNSTWMCAYAASGGNFAMLKWLRKHNCPWDHETCQRANRSVPRLIDWIHENECPCWCKRN